MQFKRNEIYYNLQFCLTKMYIYMCEGWIGDCKNGKNYFPLLYYIYFSIFPNYPVHTLRYTWVSYVYTYINMYQPFAKYTYISLMPFIPITLNFPPSYIYVPIAFCPAAAHITSGGRKTVCYNCYKFIYFLFQYVIYYKYEMERCNTLCYAVYYIHKYV